MKKYVYVAGPLNTSGRQAQNTRRAVDMAEDLLQAGFIPFVPHLYAAQWAFLHPEKEGADWLQLDMAWLARCHYMVRLFGKSEGAEMEEEFARERGIPIVYQHNRDEGSLAVIRALRLLDKEGNLCGND